MKCITGTEAEMDALVPIIDKALGYPKAGVHGGGGRHVDMPPVWDGKGSVPPGWSRSFESVWVLDANNAVIRLEPTVVAVITGVGSPLNASEKSQISSKSAAAIDLANFGTRLPKAPAVVAAAAVASFDAAAEEPNP